MRDRSDHTSDGKLNGCILGLRIWQSMQSNGSGESLFGIHEITF